MKKLSLLALLSLSLMSNNTFAKENKTDEIFSTFRFALFLGPTFNTLKPTASSADNYAITKGKSHVGFSFGINADYNMNERYTIYTGLGMDWRGGSIEALHDATPISTGYVKSADVKYKKMQYLSVPLGLKMKAVEFDKIKVFAQTGFDLGFLLSQKGDFTFVTVAPSGNDSTYTRQNEKLGGYATVVPFNLGWCIGAGAEYELSEKNSFYGAILYRNGFIDATTPKTNDKGARFSDGNIRSNSVVIRIGYFF
jgi:opacity protein-like surface antigen